MHIPPFYKRRSWQHFLLGIIAGGVISYLLLLYIYGEMYHGLHVRHAKLSTELQDVRRQNEALQQDKNEQTSEAQTIDKITIRFAPNEKVRLNRLQLIALEDMIKEELQPIIGRKTESVIENEQLIITMLENKQFTIDNNIYEVKTTKLFITNEITWTIQINQTNP